MKSSVWARLALGACLAAVGVSSNAMGQGFFRMLPDTLRPPVGGLSGNGRYVAATTTSGRVARYSIDTMELIDVAPGRATDISGDGQTIVGELLGGPFATDFVWTPQTGATPFELTVDGRSVFSRTRAVSFNGSVIVGQYLDPAFNAFRPFRWTSQTGGITLAGGLSTDVFELSGNGEVAGGWSFTNPTGARAVTWNAAGVRTSLGELPGGAVDADVQTLSANGSVVFGTSASGLSPDEIFRWTAGTGMVGLGIPFGSDNNLLTGSDAAGSTIVGNAIVQNSLGTEFRPFLWREESGFVDVESFLRDQGLDLGGVHIRAVLGISNDARTFMGFTTEGTAYVARIPSPGGVALVAVVTMTGGRRRRR